jgi:hypothetical protein
LNPHHIIVPSYPAALRVEGILRGVRKTLPLLFILSANGFLPAGSGTTLRQNAAHKTTETIKDTLHTMNTMRIQLQQIQLQLQLYKININKNKKKQII